MSIVGDLQKWLNFGLNAEQEDRFRKTNFGADIAQARIFVILILLPFVALLVNDYGFLGLSRTFYALLALRLAFAAYTVLFLKSLKGFTNYHSYDRAVFFWVLFLALANTAINSTRPENFVAHTIVTVLAVFVIVLAIPNRFTNQVILALVYTIGQTLIIVPSLRVSPQASFVVLLSMLMVNAIAITSSWLLHFWRRREFLVQEEVQKARLEAETKHASLQAIIDSLPVGLWIVDAAGRMVFINDIASKIWGGTAPFAGNVDEYNTYRAWWSETGKRIAAEDMPLTRAIRGERHIENVIYFERFDGTHGTQLVSSAPIKMSDGTIIGGVAIVQDITERKRAEEALKRSEKSLAEAQRIAHLGNWDWNIVTNELEWSDQVYRIFGRRPREFGATYDAFLSYVHPEDREYVNNAVREALNGKPYGVDHRIILASGEERIVREQGEVISDEKNFPVLMRGTVQDITEYKKAEEKIQRLADVVESSDDSILTLSLEGVITSWNKGSEQVYDYSAEEVLGKNFSMLEPANLKGEMKKLIERVKNNEKVRNYETLRLKKDGTLINVSVTLSPVFSLSGKLVAVSTIARDITERKRAEEALAKIDIARQKEIHHRIKNNLQVISSLLDLTAERFNNRECIKDSEVLKAFRESQDRVISMALIHEELYKGEGFETLNFSQYIKELSENLLRTYSVGDKDIILNMYLEENALFDMDTAVPLGIIVNELLSNSLKHAFPDIKEGEIRIELHKEENVECIKSTNEDCKSTNFVLTISDNGVGIPENFDMENLDTLGMQLVTSLVDQLDGELELKRENGTKFVVRFTVTEKDNQASAPAAQQSIE